MSFSSEPRLTFNGPWHGAACGRPAGPHVNVLRGCDAALPVWPGGRANDVTPLAAVPGEALSVETATAYAPERVAHRCDRAQHRASLCGGLRQTLFLSGAPATLLRLDAP